MRTAVHSRLREIKLGFLIFFVTGKMLSHRVRLVAERRGSLICRKVYTKREFEDVI
jgi:hypothetical protein